MRLHTPVFTVILACGTLYALASAAQTSVCGEAYEKAQEEKASAHLNAALSQLKLCVASECPKFIRDDCTRWLDQVEADIPRMVFAVRRDGQDETQVEVTCDGVVLASSLDGKAIPVDPGLRRFSFRIAGAAPIEREVLIREGERNRLVEVEFTSPKAAGAATQASRSLGPDAAPPRDQSRTALVYTLTGIGALGLAGFTLFAVLGSNQQGDLERRCAPTCPGSDVDAVKTKYYVADSCLGVGLLSLGTAAYFYFKGRTAAPPTTASVQTTFIGFVPRTSGSGGVLQLATQF